MKLPCDGQRAESERKAAQQCKEKGRSGKGKTRKREKGKKGKRRKVRLGSGSRTKILKGGPARSVRLNLLVL